MEIEADETPCTFELYIRACKKAADTWIEVQKIPDYETVVGTMLFQEIFEIAPQALEMYSFGEDFVQGHCTVPTEIFALHSFKVHAQAVVQMLESVVGMMNSDDVSSLGNLLVSLGARHIAYGVHPAHYSVVETALLRTLRKGLGDNWTEDVRKGWAAVFKFIAKGMQAGAGAEIEVMKGTRRELERQKSATIQLCIMKNSVSRDDSPSRWFIEHEDSILRSRGPPRMPSR